MCRDLTIWDRLAEIRNQFKQWWEKHFWAVTIQGFDFVRLSSVWQPVLERLA